jgi:hypothetical protein
MRAGHWLIVAGSAVLLAGAVTHGLNYSRFVATMGIGGLGPSGLASFGQLWFSFTMHLVILSAVFVIASRIPGGKRILLACALIPAIDTLLLFHYAGWFTGTFVSATATVFLVVGGFLLPERSERSPRSS